MCPANPTSFKYPTNRLLRFTGTVSDQEMFKPNPKNKDHDKDPVIMVLKNGNTSDLTVGRLNTIRAFVREYFEGKPGEMSKEVSVLPRNSKSGPFSHRGDSGSVVLDGKEEFAGFSLAEMEPPTSLIAPTLPRSNFSSSAWLTTRSTPTSSPCPPICKGRSTDLSSVRVRLSFPIEDDLDV